ncbi:MAG: oligoendopeptidase F [Lachnospiraceae bacterium]|jgi:oligoendopeptidase F|nr:oligoendopeptidase F [Lachnospiraceae bacterium]
MEEVRGLTKREDVKKEDTWATEDLYESDKAWEEDYARCGEFIDKLASFEGKLKESGEAILAYYKADEELDVYLDRLGGYAFRKADEDTANSFYQDYSAKVMAAYVKIDAATAYVTPEILSISDEDMERFYKETEGLEVYKTAIENKRRRKAHFLSSEMEALLADAGDVTGQPDKIFGMLNDADITYPDAVDGEGKPYAVTHGSFIPSQTQKDRVLRKSAFESVYHTYKQFSNTFASILGAQVKTLQFNAKARKYDNTLEAALDVTNVPVSVYFNLIEAVHDNMDKMYNYVALRKKLLKVDELHFYDVYTPITEASSQKIPYEEAVQNVLEAVKPLGEEYGKVLKSGFENRWVDKYENKGKRSGAYSSGALVHPFVLMNYSDNLDSEFTLAHEMGHAMHSYLSNKHQPRTYAHYKIFVAEIASTCNEALLMQYLLKKTTDKKERAILINHFLEQFKGTLYRQTMFAEFELKINRLAEAGTTLTADVLSKEYEELNKLYFGDGIVIDDEIRYEWCRIPHFYYNYYVFQYATGFSAAIALSQKILNEGAPAVEKYLKFLSGGCSKDPISLLKDAGVDMTTAEPINQALKLFGELIDEMDELTQE